MSNIGSGIKRRRIKIKCLVCSRVFDDDYRIEHNNRHHPEYRKQNILVPYGTLGVPKNPFEAAKRKQERFETNIEVIKYTYINNNKRMQ